MSDDSTTLPSNRATPGDPLPRVEPPSITFLLQLFVIPLAIVSLIVLVWMLFSWLAHAGTNPREMVREIRAGRDVSWQRAVTLASLLDHSNWQYEALRRDEEFATELCDVLRDELAKPLSGKGKLDEGKLRVRYYLCRILGQMETGVVVPTLLEAAVLERHPAEIDIRLGALEALAVLADKIDDDAYLANGKTLEVLLECSRAADGENEPAATSDSSAYRPHGEVRGAAAYALGIMGGATALDRLAEMTSDLYPNARYNAATALARHGDARCVPVVLEMLNPENDLAVKDEKYAANQDIRRIQVLKNGLMSADRYREKAKADVSQLRDAIATLRESKLDRIQEVRAREGLHKLADETFNRFK